jgi:radical SAM protein with 4Fe4S-binding SPASM domain
MPVGDRRIPPFQQLEIETRSTCNRACPGCLRNSHPDRAALRPWFEPHELPEDLVERLFTEALAHQNRIHPCGEPLRRLIINHRGDMLLCYDDLAGHFRLGNIRDHTVEQLWFGDRHQDLVLALQAPDGRWCHPHCMSCPRP